MFFFFVFLNFNECLRNEQTNFCRFFLLCTQHICIGVDRATVNHEPLIVFFIIFHSFFFIFSLEKENDRILASKMKWFCIFRRSDFILKSDFRVNVDHEVSVKKQFAHFKFSNELIVFHSHSCVIAFATVCVYILTKRETQECLNTANNKQFTRSIVYT